MTEQERKKRRADTNMVLKRVPKEFTYDVYGVVDGEVTKLDTIKTKGGRLLKDKIAQQYGVKQIMINEVSKTYVRYGMDLASFLELAQPLDDETLEPLDPETLEKITDIEQNEEEQSEVE